MATLRADQTGAHRQALARNKRKILATQETCGICGHIVDKTLPYGNPLSPVIDHIIPISKGGHPSDLANLQLAHWTCNRQKSDKLYQNMKEAEPKVIGNRNLPQSADWTSYNK